MTTARLAQSAERKALNLVVVGSSPTVGVFLQLQSLQKNFQNPCQHVRCEVDAEREAVHARLPARGRLTFMLADLLEQCWRNRQLQMRALALFWRFFE